MLGYKPWYYLVRLHDLVNSCLLYIWKNIRGSSNPLRGGSRAAATSKMECFVKAVNYYHKALHLGCCSSPRSASAPCYFILDIVFIKYQPFQSNALSKICQNRGFLWSVFSYIRTFFMAKRCAGDKVVQNQPSGVVLKFIALPGKNPCRDRLLIESHAEVSNFINNGCTMPFFLLFFFQRGYSIVNFQAGVSLQFSRSI